MPELSPFKINNMSCNAGFALEYLLHRNPRAKELINDGIELCSMIEKGSEIKDTITGSELEFWEFMQVMKRFFKPEELSEITKEAKEIKSKLSNISNGKCEYIEEKEIRKMQHFFNRIGSPFLKLSIQKSRRR